MSARERVFIDTNVLVYADDISAGAKRKRAIALIGELAGEGRAVVSTQVLQEYFAVATRKLGVPAPIARRKVEAFARLNVVLVGPELILGAIDVHARHAISFWDALIVQAAAAGSCRVLLSEDLGDGQTLAGVRVVNPFAARGARDRRVTYGRRTRPTVGPAARSG